MNEQTLYLAWQDQIASRRWFPVGRLDVDLDKPVYRFRYIQGAKEAQATAKFKPLPYFPAFEKDYRSSELFPLFCNALMPAVPDFKIYLEQLGLDPSHGDPIEILAVSGGQRVTDEFQVFPSCSVARTAPSNAVSSSRILRRQRGGPATIGDAQGRAKN